MPKVGAGSVVCLIVSAAMSFTAAGSVRAWTPVPVANDPLVRMPGSQPGSVSLEASRRCLNCHDQYDPTVDPGFHWQGSMMAQAMRDPFFWAALTVAAQDSIWAVGRPNATDLCLRCHTPSGWLGGRSDPTNGSLMVADDFDGVSCDACHRMMDPHFEDAFDGSRESADFLGYWDEANGGGLATYAPAVATRDADRLEAEVFAFFNGDPFFDAVTHRPAPPGWSDAGGGQFFVTESASRRANFADAEARHAVTYSRFHRSRTFCGACHDVSNAVLHNLDYAGTSPGDGATVLPSEADPAHSYFHVERTYSEFRLSAYGAADGAPGSGFFDPSTFATSQPENRIATCQDCHMPDREGAGCDKAGAVVRPSGSTAHPGTGQPLHDLTGGNMLVPFILASTVVGAPNYDETNATLLAGRASTLTMDLAAGLGLEPIALLDGARRAGENLAHAASIENLAYDAGTGELSFRVRNHTGHKLPSGFPEGRRVFVNVRVWDGGMIAYEVNPYDREVATLRGLPPAISPSSPPLRSGEVHDDALVYEVHPSSSLTGESHTFHFVLADDRYKDNRIPPRGFRIDEAAGRESVPAWRGAPAPDYFTPSEYAGGHDDVMLSVPIGADGVEVRVYYQTTSREYVEFLRDEIDGSANTLSSPTPSGEPSAYVVRSDPFFVALREWGTTIWDLWWHNRDVPGAAPVEMTRAVVGVVGDPCSLPGSDGNACDDGDECTTVDRCAAGRCLGESPRVCAGATMCRRAGVCVPETGECDYAAVPDGTVCADGDACTTVDECVAGACAGTSPVTCAPIDACHGAGVCDPAVGSCSTPPLPDGTLCPGGECVDGLCVTASPDMGVPDAGVLDAGVADAGPMDMGAPDAGAPDIGVVDGGTSDAGSPDADTPDSGSPDVGLSLDGGHDPRDLGGVLDAGSAPRGGAGCSCRVGANPAGRAAPPIWLGLGALAFVARRRRGRHRSFRSRR